MGVPGVVAATFKFMIGGSGTGMGVPAIIFRFALGGIGMGIGVPGHPAETAAAKNNVITIFSIAFLRIFSLLFSSEYSDGFCRLTDGRDRGPIVLFKMVGQKSIGRAYRKLRGGFYWLCYCASRHSLNRNEKRN